jgi:hypothetical protein
LIEQNGKAKMNLLSLSGTTFFSSLSTSKLQLFQPLDAVAYISSFPGIEFWPELTLLILQIEDCVLWDST